MIIIMQVAAKSGPNPAILVSGKYNVSISFAETVNGFFNLVFVVL